MKRLLPGNIFTVQEIKAVRELGSFLRESLGNQLIRFVLYGSRARGYYDPESNIDVAIIVRGLTRELKNQILDKVAEIQRRG